MYDVLLWTQPNLAFWQESWNNKNHSSFFCVVSSWGSFLITPQVWKTAQLIQFQSSRLFSQRIPDSYSLYFSYFRWFLEGWGCWSPCFYLSLLFSSPQSHPALRWPSALSYQSCLTVQVWMSWGDLGFFSSGFCRCNSSCLLGSCPLLLHIWSHFGLHAPTGPDKDEQLWGGGGKYEGCRCEHKSLEDWQKHASNFSFFVHPVQFHILASMSFTSMMINQE